MCLYETHCVIANNKHTFKHMCFLARKANTQTRKSFPHCAQLEFNSVELFCFVCFAYIYIYIYIYGKHTYIIIYTYIIYYIYMEYIYIYIWSALACFLDACWQVLGYGAQNITSQISKSALAFFWMHLGYFWQVLGFGAQNITSQISENALVFFLDAFGILLTRYGLRCAEHNFAHLKKRTCIFYGCIWDTFWQVLGFGVQNITSQLSKNALAFFLDAFWDTFDKFGASVRRA